MHFVIFVFFCLASCFFVSELCRSYVGAIFTTIYFFFSMPEVLCSLGGQETQNVTTAAATTTSIVTVVLLGTFTCKLFSIKSFFLKKIYCRGIRTEVVMVVFNHNCTVNFVCEEKSAEPAAVTLI